MKLVSCIDCKQKMEAGFDCWCEFILKQGKRNKDQLNIFEVLQ